MSCPLVEIFHSSFRLILSYFVATDEGAASASSGAAND